MRTAILLALLTCLAPAASAEFGDFFVVPAAAHGPGLGGSMWQTDIIIHNVQTTPITVEVALAESGLGLTDNFAPVMIDNAATFTVAPGATRILSDLLNNHRNGASAMGALLIGADQPFVVTSRIYNVDASGVTVGQTVPAARDFLSTSTGMAVIPGLAANANFRTNIGFVAAAGALPLVVEVALIGSTGTRLGASTFNVLPGRISHVQLSTVSLTTEPFDLATATIRILAGSGDVTGYASVIDNRTNHASFVSSSVPGSSAAQSTFAKMLKELR